MITSRFALVAALGFFSTMVSFDPRVIASGKDALPARPTRPVIAAPDVASPLAGPVSAEPPPADLKVEVTPDGQGHRVLIRRPGHLVALEYGAARAAGKDWAAVHVELGARQKAGKKAKAEAEALDSLVWETTPLEKLTTARGMVALRLEGAELRADLSLAATPAPAGTSSGPHHTCVAHRDPSSGFTVLCRLHHGAKRVSAASVTGARVGEGAWVIPGKEPIVRLDLPLMPGLAEARVVGFVHGLTGAVIRAEASWTEGEAPSLVIQETERAQPVASEIDWR